MKLIGTIILSVLMCSGNGHPLCGNAEITTDEVISYFTDQQNAIDGMLLSFDVVFSYGKGSEIPAVGKELPVDFVLQNNYESIKQGSKYRILKSSTRTNANLQPLLEQTEFYTWNGAESRTLVRQVDGSEDVVIGLSPLKSHYMEHFLTWQGWNVFQLQQQLSYSELLCDKYIFAGPELLLDGTTRWRCLINQEKPEIEIDIYATRLDDRVVVQKAEMRIYNSGIDARSVDSMPSRPTEIHRGIGVIEFGKMQPIGEGMIASTAKIINMNRVGDAIEPDFWGTVDITLLKASTCDITDDTFRISITDPQVQVVDTRYNISYQLGKDSLNFDGRILVTSKPLYGNIGDNLEWWVTHGKLGPVIDPNTNRMIKDG